MLTNNRPRSFVALVALLAIAFSTAPISAADFNTKPVIGSVSAVGSVDLRGVAISQEGTLFPGDQVSVGAKGYAKITLLNGHKLELAAMTKLTVVGSKQSAQLQVTSGNVGFATQSGALDITAGNYQITGDHNVAGNVAYVGNGFIGLHIKSGTVTVRNLTTKETVKVSTGQDRLFSLQGDANRPLAQLASNGLPGPVPGVPPAPDPQAGGGNAPAQANGITRTGWIAIFGTIGGAAAAIAVLATRPNTSTSTNTATVLQQQNTTAVAQAAQTTAATASAVATQAAAAATSVSVAIAAATSLPTATRTTLTTQAQTLAAAATATQQQIVTLQQQIQQLQSQLSGASGAQVTAIQNQINTVINSLNADTTQLNNEINQLNSLVASAVAAGVPNTPSVPVTIQPIPPANTASASIPG